MVNIIEEIEENIGAAEKAIGDIIEKKEKKSSKKKDIKEISKKKIEETPESEEIEEEIDKADEDKDIEEKPENEEVEEKETEEEEESDELSGEELEREAEAESVDPEKEKSLLKKKKELLEKAEKLREKVSIERVSTEELKEKIKAKKRTDMLIPLEEYVKSGIYIGTKVITPAMRAFVYRRRADGLAIFNTDLIDEKLKEAIEFLSKFDAKDVIVVCKRQAGWRVVEMFSQLTGIRAFTKKYPAGILTNTQLSGFFEDEVTIISDSWLDKNAMNDTINVHKKVLMICDTNNFAKGAEHIIIGNNKSAKSLGVIFYLLTRGYCKARGITADIPDLEWWVREDEKGAEMGV